jgi:calcineurin-like phosphoesterase family protein
MDTLITSDTHYAHANIIKYSNRPFADAEAMNTTLVDNINGAFPQGGRLYHLGDWAFGGLARAIEFKERLRSDIEIYLILGNHDTHHVKHEAFRKLFTKIYDLYETHLDGHRTTLCHYSMRVWNKSHHGAWMLYGHSHGSLADDPNSLSFDVGVDCHNFKPLTIPQIAHIMSKKTWKPVDHHGASADKVWVDLNKTYYSSDKIQYIPESMLPDGRIIVYRPDLSRHRLVMTKEDFLLETKCAS